MQRFWAKVALCHHGWECQNCCWVWQGARGKNGYGNFTVIDRGKQRTKRASRLAFELCFAVALPSSIQVCHTCDNPPCCNPAHLFAGTKTDNMRDASRKGRIATGDRHGLRLHPERATGAHNPLRGETHPHQCLTNVAVQHILIAYRAGATMVELARFYEVSHSAVSSVLSGKNWRHLTGGVDIRRGDRYRFTEEDLRRGVITRRQRSHLSAQTHCMRGHLFDIQNTYLRRNGTRECRACKKARYHKAADGSWCRGK